MDLLLSEYGNGKGYMTPEEFAKYLKEEQGLADVELDMCQELVQTYEPIPENAKNGWMGIDGEWIVTYGHLNTLREAL